MFQFYSFSFKILADNDFNDKAPETIANVINIWMLTSFLAIKAVKKKTTVSNKNRVVLILIKFIFLIL